MKVSIECQSIKVVVKLERNEAIEMWNELQQRKPLSDELQHLFTLLDAQLDTLAKIKYMEV